MPISRAGKRRVRPNISSRGPYATWTIDDLICANAARPVPLPLTELPKYAGHSYTSINVRYSVAKRTGRLSRDGVFLSDHPLNATIQPLPDLPPGWTLPDPSPGQPAHAAILAGRVGATVGESVPAGLSYDRLLAILDNYIINGGSGRDILTAIKTRLEQTDLSRAAGPPPPSTPAAMTARLVALLREVPPDIVNDAIAQWRSNPLPTLLETPCAETTPSPDPSSTQPPSNSSPIPKSPSPTPTCSTTPDSMSGTTSCLPPTSESESTPTPPPSPTSPPLSTSSSTSSSIPASSAD